MEQKFSITWEVLKSGQPRPHADSIYIYKVFSDSPEYLIMGFCTQILKPSKNKGSNFSGSSSFPFGLESFYSFEKTGEHEYLYKVCQPYTG